MKFEIATQELNYLISKIQNVVPLKPTMPILTNFLIEASNDELVLSATDLTVSVRCSIEVKILEEGSTTLPAKRLGQLARELTTPIVEISCNSQDVTTLVAGTSHFKLNGMNRKGYPDWPNLSQADSFLIPQNILKDLLYRTSFAVSREENRYVLTGLFMQVDKGKVTFSGTDGKRLSKTLTAIAAPTSFSGQAIIPLKAIEEILKCLEEEGDAKITILPEKIIVEANDTVILTKLIAGDYPDTSRIIPESATHTLSLHREELISLLKQVSLFISDPHRSVRFVFANGELQLIANTANIGEGIVAMPVNYQGEPLEIAFNPGYFLDILRHCKEETVLLGLTDAHNPGMIAEGNHEGVINQASLLFIIMPMRLSED